MLGILSMVWITNQQIKSAIDLLTREYEKMTWDEVTEEIVDLYDEDTLIDLLPDAK